MTKLSLSYLRRLIAESGGGGVWGSITGTLSSQTDLQSALNAKEGSISAGNTSQYWRGDKSWQTLNKSAVGLGNVDNTADVNKSVASAAILTTARKINGVSFDGSADINVIDSVNMYAAMGSVILGSSYNLPLGNVASTVTLSNQSFRLVPIWLPKSGTITGIKWYQSIQGDYTANNYNGVGLYTYSGGTLTLVASSTDDGNIWKATANTWASKAFSSTYSATAGLLFVGLLWCRSAQVTAPSLGVSYSPGNAGIASLDLTNSAKIAGSVASLTALPATQAMSGVTASTNCYAIGLY